MISVMVFIVLAVPNQLRVGNTEDFKGFVPDASTAINVATPILRRVMGHKYVSLSEPLRAKLIMGRWVVSGTGQGAKKVSPDIVVEPYVIAIDKWSARVALFGALANVNVEQTLKKIKPDGPKPVSRHPKR